MRLKQLSMLGFKSFAKKTDFHFPTGLTCIVGPNGCGKSNVVDAIKWVLGEQRPSALRGKEMADVIFAGAAGRKALGLAEVTLIFDNPDDKLDVEWSEVEVTRRLYRDGTSEYLLNRNRCRLRDVREMLMDTGSGPGALTIMEQGKIDQVLRESHSDRRAVFEEAAGIAKYKARRKETLRRLERVEADLLRISDLVAEKQRLVRSLKIQAGRAERYRDLLDKMRKKRLSLAVHRYGKLTAERDRATKQVEELDSGEREARDLVKAALADCRSAEEHVDTARTTASRLEQRIASLEGRMETAHEKSAFAARLAAELDGKIRWYGEEVDASLERLEELAGTGEDVLRTLGEAERDRATRQDEVRAAETSIASRSRDVAERRERAEDLERRAYAAFARRAELERDRSRLDAQVQGLDVQAGRLSETRDRLSDEQTSSERRAEKAADVATRAETASRDAAAELATAEQRSADAEAELAERRDEVSALEREDSALSSRRDLLDDLCTRMDGLADGARRLVAASKERGGPRGVRGALADLIEVDTTDAPAVAAALGPYASAVVVDSFASAERAAAYLRESGSGGCLLLPLDEVSAPAQISGAQVARSEVLGALVSGAQATGALAGRVRVPRDLRPVIDALLGDAVEVSTLSEARRSRRRNKTTRFVTADGDVVLAVGAIAAGGVASGGSAVERRTELRDVAKRLTKLERATEAARSSLAKAGEKNAKARSVLTDTRAAARSADVEAERLRTARLATDEERTRLAGDRGRIDLQLAEIAADVTRFAALAATAGDETASLVASQEGLESGRASAVAELAAAEQELRALETERADARVRLATVAERCASLAARRDATETEISDLERTVEEAREELAGCELRKVETGERGDQAREELARSEKERERAIVDLAEMRHGLSTHATKLDERRAALAVFEEQAAGVGRELQRFRLQQNEARVRVETLVERIDEELETDLHAAWQAAQQTDATTDAGMVDGATPVYAENEAQFDEAAVEQAVQELRDKLARMGNVNLEALDQLDETEREASGLLKEHEDLTNSRQTLLDTIKRIDEESREMFVTTFDTIRKNFREMFRRLFEGGKADVMLDEGQDVLEAGVEIVARPPGKELRSISLLSGGERTMTAVALLFAIYQAKPSSFCLLDEVDAALDDANVGRFASVVQEFAEESQFIIVTHNKQTMGVAETIFGVTMREPGVSQRIAVRLDQITHDGELAA